MLLALLSLSASAQNGGIKGKVVSRNNREALSNVTVTVEPSGQTVRSDNDGNFVFEELNEGDYSLKFSAPEFETLDIKVRVDRAVKNINTIVMTQASGMDYVDDSIFAELDTDAETDGQALPSSLGASKDIFNSIASFKFSEMRFNVRGYDSQYSDINLNGIRFNDALTGYGPWSLWSGLNDATRNQENVAGLGMSDTGVGGIGGQTNIFATASQMRKGFRVSAVNANQMYRFRLMLSYASGALDNGWSYAFSFSTRQGGNSYVDGVYYNAYAYFASVEKQFRNNQRLALTVLAAPTERGAQQASTQEAYELFGNRYYNPNVGYQNGKLRNTRVRNTHEPIAMLNYTWDITDNTRLTAAASLRFGYNGYSALTWNNGADPRPDYYRKLPSYYLKRRASSYPDADNAGPTGQDEWLRQAFLSAMNWNPYVDFDEMIRTNYVNYDYAAVNDNPSLAGKMRSNYMIEERHTDQLDFNFVANISHRINNNSRILAGIKARVNRTEYYDQVKDLLGGDYWLDVDKFAERDLGWDPLNYQNDVAYYNKYGHALAAREGDKISYDYYAHVRAFQLWAQYGLNYGGFSMGLGAEVGTTSMWRYGMWQKGLFMDDSYGKSLTQSYLTYKVKGNFGYRFSGAHALTANVTAMQDAPTFQSAFVSPRTRHQATPNIKPEKLFSAELSYDLTLPYLQARLAGYYTTVCDQAKVISFYDDTQSSFTNFAMSGIDKRYYGLELGLSIPIAGGLSLNGALSWGDYTYTSNPYFTQLVDNRAEVIMEDVVLWKGMHVESSPQIAGNVGLNYRAPHNWFLSADFNYYDRLFLSMNPMYRTSSVIMPYIKKFRTIHTAEEFEANVEAIRDLRHQEMFDSAYTLNASIGKNWYIHRTYTLGFSLQVNNILNNQNIRTGGYEQMRLNRTRDNTGTDYYSRFDSKYFYMLGTTYYLNLYFRF